MTKKKKKTPILKILLSKNMLLLFQLLFTLLVLLILYRLKMLPLKYYIVVGVAFLLTWFGTYKFLKSGLRKKKQYNKKIQFGMGKILSICMSVLMVFLSLAISRGDSFISNISGALTQTRVIGVYTLNSSEIKTVKDLRNKKIGVQYSKGAQSIGLFENKLSDKLGTNNFKEKEYKNYSQLGDALYKQEIDAVIVDQAYTAMIEVNHDNFNGDTKCVYKTETKEKIKSVTTSTDVTSKPFIVYMTGLDTYGTVSTVSRTDVNLLMCVNPNKHQILMVSVPRDTEIKLHKNGKLDKLTHSAMYGTDETISTMEDFLDMKVNYYAKTNFQGITNIVDALDGVTINSPYAFTTMHGHYNINKGENEMDGDKALCFVRERYALPNGDFDRGKNQQRLLKAMLKKCLSSKIITNYENILSAVEGCFETNMSSGDIKSLVNMQINDGSGWEMFNVQLQGEGHKTNKTYSMSGQYVYTMKPDKESLNGIKQVIDKIENDKKISKSDVKGLS